MTQNSNDLNLFAPLQPHGQDPKVHPLSWADLSQLFEEFPNKLCDRFELIASLYDDGLCDEVVTQEMMSHIDTCLCCQQELQSQRNLSEEFLGLRTALSSHDLQLSDAQLQESFQMFVKAHGDVFSDFDHNLEVKETSAPAHDRQMNKPIMQVEFDPQPKIKLRHKAILGLVSAAALLFAYGPALIETEIKESEFPEVKLSKTISQDNQHALPFMHDLNTQVHSSLTQEHARLQQFKVSTSTTGQYSVKYEWVYNGEKMPVQLSVTSLNQQQAQQLKRRLMDQKEVITYSVKGQVKNKSVKVSQVGQVQQLEYLSKLQHLQWSSQHPKSKKLLALLGELQLSSN